MTETPRIRWHETPVGTFAGYVGTLVPRMFAIWDPSSTSGEWVLTTDLPGMAAERRYKDNPEDLKAEAEQWLSQFTDSLGALFPDDTRAVTTAGTENQQ